MRKIALLRGVTPTGRNRIPKMSYLAEVLQDAGFSQVQTYIQSGNIVLDTALSCPDTKALIHRVILEKIGADLEVILKDAAQLAAAGRGNPFSSDCDISRIHLVFTNNRIGPDRLNKLLCMDFGGELLRAGTECLYLYLPRDAKPKRLNTNYLEKQLGITATMRKLSVVAHLCEMGRSL